MRQLRKLCVFCGSRDGAHPRYVEAGRTLGRLLAAEGITLVYGGASVGVMGALAGAVMEAGGEAIGVIPRALGAREVAMHTLTDLRWVETMHERKAMMYDEADAFMALPGGFGTLDELCEVVTWGQLGLQRKPCGLLNIAGYFDHFAAFIEHAVGERFILPRHRELLMMGDDAAVLLERFRAWRAPRLERWIERRDT